MNIEKKSPSLLQRLFLNKKSLKGRLILKKCTILQTVVDIFHFFGLFFRFFTSNR